MQKPIVTIEMDDGGVIKIELYPTKAPETVKNFISLIKKGSGYSIKGEFKENGFENPLTHVRGMVSMARSMMPDSAGSQFFIVTDDSEFLDGKYAAFGQVIEGMETVDKIVKSRVITRSPYGGGKDRPVEPPVMKKVMVDTFGEEYEEPNKIIN